MSIEKITYRPEGAKRSSTVLLENVTVGGDPARLFLGPDLVMGREVDTEGVIVAPEDAGGADGERLHLIEESLVLKREPMIVDHAYGFLVKAGTATQQMGWHWHVDADLSHFFRYGRRDRLRSACGRWQPDSTFDGFDSDEQVAVLRRDGLLCSTCQKVAESERTRAPRR